MKSKTIATVVLSVFVLASVGFLVAKEVNRRAELKTAEQANPAPVKSAARDRQVVVYYFHGAARCETCRKIEEYAAEVVNVHFKDAVTSGLLDWRVVNVEEAENEHFVKDYKLYSKHVVLVEMEKGRQKRWKNLDKIWDFVDQKPVFQAYIGAAVSEFLGES
jgi:thiol-disulfide isomerase/thioredoxin